MEELTWCERFWHDYRVTFADDEVAIYVCDRCDAENMEEV